MALLHSSSATMPADYMRSLERTKYQDLKGIPHHISADEPGINGEGDAFIRFKETMVPKERFRSQIDAYHGMLDASATTLIDGDWKPENIYHGYKVDFGCVGKGLEIDDLAFYCSDYEHRMDYAHFQRCVDEYVHYRRSLDPASLERTSSQSLGLTDGPVMRSAWLRQLVLRHCVLKKRDLTKDENYHKRQYYKERIEESLAAGGFL
jgi:Ser/Thr protein kinase RdoA (MazF antagonist)